MTNKMSQTIKIQELIEEYEEGIRELKGKKNEYANGMRAAFTEMVEDLEALLK